MICGCFDKWLRVTILASNLPSLHYVMRLYAVKRACYVYFFSNFVNDNGMCIHTEKQDQCQVK